MNYATPESLRRAQEVVDSARVLRTHAACEWDELSEDGKHWVAALVEEAQVRALTGKLRDTLRQSGIKPAPFALSPVLVERALKAVELPAPTITQSARASTPPAMPGSSIEPARCRPKQADPSAPVESSPPALDRPDTIALKATPAGNVVPISISSEPARRIDVQHRQSKDRDARSLEKPVDDDVRSQRREVLAQAARRFAVEKIALPTADKVARLPLGRPETKAAAVPASGFERRLQMLQGAIAFLKRRCILVSVVNRDAQIRTYLVSGKRQAMLASEVIEFAASLGFEVQA